MVVGLVDLSAVIAFHPVMRNFDYHARKFLKPWDGKRQPTGIEAWEKNKDLIFKIRTVEGKISRQIVEANNSLKLFADKKIKESEKNLAFDTLKALNQKRVEMLADLTRKTIGMFSDESFTDADDRTGNYVMGEIRRAIYDVAVRNNVAFVFNTSKESFSSNLSLSAQLASTQTPQGILDRFEIRNLDDLQKLIFETGKQPTVPFGKPHAKMNFTKGACGEHFEQVKDPAHLQVLMDEYFQNREIFTDALVKYDSKRFLLHGSVAVAEKNLTREVIQYIFDLHKTRKPVQEAAFNALK